MRQQNERNRLSTGALTTVVGLAAVAFFVGGLARSHTEALAEVNTGAPESAAAARVEEDDDAPYGVQVSDSRSFTHSRSFTDGNPDDGAPGEVQSTVVPPGKNRVCPAGRLLISNDRVKDPASVAWLDLNLTDFGQVSYANVDTPPGWEEGFRTLASNDHDLIALPNGEVLLLKMGRTKVALDPTPAWFDSTYKIADPVEDSWGPGARSEIFVWRSVDCGQTFTFVSGIDTATIDDEFGTLEDWSGGLPQTNGSTGQMWQMGGTDGPLARVDPNTGRVFITIGLVGNKPDPSSPEFSLSSEKLKRTVVMMSSDKGSTWERASVRWFTGWRVDVVPRENDILAFGHYGSNQAFIAPSNPIGYIDTLQFLSSLAAPKKQGWNTSYCDHKVLYTGSKFCVTGPGDSMKINLLDAAILTRSPSSENLLFTYTSTIVEEIPGGPLFMGDGFRMYLSGGGSAWTELPPITPRVTHPDNFVLHVTPIDVGRGPIFFYWYDVDVATGDVLMRGRLVTKDNASTVDFAVSHQNSAPHSFNVTGKPFWYGDYHTAGGYYALQRGGTYRYHYYPVWVQPDGKVHFAHVQFDPPVPALVPTLPGYVQVHPALKTVYRMQIDASQLEMEREEEEPIRR